MYTHLCLAQYIWDQSVLMYVSGVTSHVFMYKISISLFIFLLADIWFFSQVSLLWLKMLWTFLYKSFLDIYSFLLGIYLQVEFLGYRADMFSSSNVCKFQVLHVFANTWYFAIPLMLSHSGWRNTVSHGFNFHFPDEEWGIHTNLHDIYTNTDEYHFMCLLVIYISFVKCLFWNQDFSPFLKIVFLFLIIDLEKFFSWLLFVLPCYSI